MPFPPPEDLPDLGIELVGPASLELADGFFTAEPPGKPSLLSFFVIFIMLSTKMYHRVKVRDSSKV